MKVSISKFMHPDYHGPWYCLNKSAGKLRGNVTFNVSEPHTGNPVPVQIPDTFLAIDLLEKATKQQLSDSADFRQALDRRLLVLVDEDEALEINSRAGANTERRRLQRRRETSAAMQSASYGGVSGATALVDETGEEAEATANELAGIHPRLWGVAEKVREEGEIGVINSLRAVVDDLSIKDLRYARKVAREEEFSKLGKYAGAQLRKRKEGGRTGGTSRRRRRAAATA